jgi:hypothetical protein
MPGFSLGFFTARLKSCPDTKHQSRDSGEIRAFRRLESIPNTGLTSLEIRFSHTLFSPQGTFFQWFSLGSCQTRDSLCYREKRTSAAEAVKRRPFMTRLKPCPSLTVAARAKVLPFVSGTRGFAGSGKGMIGTEERKNATQVAEALEGLRPVFFGPRTLGRTWGTRPGKRASFFAPTTVLPTNSTKAASAVSTSFYWELFSSTLYFLAAVSIRFQAARRSASVTSFT